MLESSGKNAASVLPPAVGASTTQLHPSRMAPIASSWTGRSDAKPSVLATWNWNAGLSRSNAPISAPIRGPLRGAPHVQRHVVGGELHSGGLALLRGHLLGRHHQLEVLARVVVRVLVHLVQDVAHQLAE